MHTPEINQAEQRKTLLSIVKSANTAFFVTEGDLGLHGRPMANAKVEEDLSTIWFATQRNSGKIAELRQDQKVLLGYSNSSGSEWATINGVASLVNDRAKIKELWSSFWKNWFEGPDDPNILLIRVSPQSAEYWNSGSKTLAMIKFTIAAVTGKKLDEGENQRVSLG
jgi:general stress protein 26